MRILLTCWNNIFFNSVSHISFFINNLCMIEILLRYSILALNSVAVISMTHRINTKKINCIHNIVCKLVVKQLY